MAQSARLIRRLESDSNDEPLAKRLKLAENVLCSSDTLIFRKEDCIYQWLCSELSKNNDKDIWSTIHRCLTLDPKNFSKLTPATKDLLIDSITGVLGKYPSIQVLDDTIKCCDYIFLNTNSQGFTGASKILNLLQVLFEFANKVLKTSNEKENFCIVLESAEVALNAFSLNCRQRHFLDVQDLMIVFIDKFLFPLSSLIQTVRCKRLSSKIILGTQKCIKKLTLGSIKHQTLSTNGENKKTEDAEVFFNTLRNKINTVDIEETKVAIACLFESLVNIFQNNVSFIDQLLRKFVDCAENRDNSKQILTVLIENSMDVSFNYDNKIDGVSFKNFLKNWIDEIINKKKHLKNTDYELLSSISKLNPLIADDMVDNILDRILIETPKKENVVRDILILELWKASVRLRRHQRFLSKFLLGIRKIIQKESEDMEFTNDFELPTSFLTEISKDLKSKTTTSQISVIFSSLNYHFKTDCINNIQITNSTGRDCLMTKIVAKLFIIFFESCSFLENSLPRDLQVKFYTNFSELKDLLGDFSKKLHDLDDNFNVNTTAFKNFSDIVKVWCETYDLLRYYYPSEVTNNKLSFPVEETHLNKFMQFAKKKCKTSLTQLLFFKLMYYNNDDQHLIDRKIIKHLWSMILENHIEIVESFNETQLLELTLHFVQEACSLQENVDKWSLFLKQNIFRITKKFATSSALQVIVNLVEDVESSTCKTITEKIDFTNVLKSLDDTTSLKNVLKKAAKEFSKQNFKSLDHVDIDKVKRNLTFLSSLPILYLDTEVRIFLFMVLYTFEKEIENSFDTKDLFTHFYLDFLRKNDINILEYVLQPMTLINHFKENRLMLSKILKLSLKNLTETKYLEEILESNDCDVKICSNLLIFVDDLKKKNPSGDRKNALRDLSLKLSEKITKDYEHAIDDPDEIAGLRISLKIIFSKDKKEIEEGLKKHVESLIKNVAQNVVNVTDENLISEILQLLLITLQNRTIFNVDRDVVEKMCIALSRNTDEKVLIQFFEVLNNNEFYYFTKVLQNQTRDSIIKGDVKSMEKVPIIWESLSKMEIKVDRSKSLKSCINDLFNKLMCSEINKDSAVYLIKIFKHVVQSQKMIRLSCEIIDSIFYLTNLCLNDRSSNDTTLIICQEALGLCLNFLRYKSDFLLDRLFVFKNLFYKIIQTILHVGRETNFFDDQTLRILAVDIEKFCTFFAKLKKNVARISSYLIVDLIDLLSNTQVLPTFLKNSLDSSISQLLTNCDHHSISFMTRALPVSNQQIFKTIYDNYKKYHKFTGKI